MSMVTHQQGTLFVAFELREKTWKSPASPRGMVKSWVSAPLAARHQERVLDEIAQAKRRLSLLGTSPVVSCYEAGREGFWLHRFLQGQGITNHVVDSSAIEVNRRRRRAKSAGLDVRKLLSMLMRYAQGERQVWQESQGALGGGRGSPASAPGLGNPEAGASQTTTASWGYSVARGCG